MYFVESLEIKNFKIIFFPGVADCVLALGFEKMEKGSLSVGVGLIYYYFGVVMTL